MQSQDFIDRLFENLLTPNIEVVFSNNITDVSDKLHGTTFCDVYLNGRRLATGTAYCGENDTYDEVKGCQVALKRALLEAEKVSPLIDKEARAEVWQRFQYTTW